MEETVFLNGSLVPLSSARISPLDSGLLYGYGLFETMRAYSGRIFHSDKHLERLLRSAIFLGIHTGMTVTEMEGHLYSTLEANGLNDARIRLTVTGGQASTIPDLITTTQPNILITARPYSPPNNRVYEQGYSVQISNTRRNSQSTLSRIKSLNFLDMLIAKREAKQTGHDDAVLLNDKGMVTEASTSNLFILVKGVLITPSEESGLLPGITREIVLELAGNAGLSRAVRGVTLAELYRAEEAFLTNSMIEIMPLTRVDGQVVGDGRCGSITRQLMTAYKERVRKECTSE